MLPCPIPSPAPSSRSAPSRAPSPKRWFDNNDPVARDTEYRWDGVHVSGKGAKLVFETIIPSLQAIPNA